MDMRFRTAHFVKAQAFVQAAHPFVLETERKINTLVAAMSALDRVFQDAVTDASILKTQQDLFVLKSFQQPNWYCQVNSDCATIAS